MSCKAKGLRCYARRYPNGVWGAKCVDLEIATEGRSLAHAQEMLDEAVLGFFESLRLDYTPEEAAELLERKSPLWERAAWELFYHAGVISHHIGKAKAFLMTRPNLHSHGPVPTPC